jgi:hypothetical protein
LVWGRMKPMRLVWGRMKPMDGEDTTLFINLPFRIKTFY